MQAKSQNETDSLKDSNLRFEYILGLSLRTLLISLSIAAVTIAVAAFCAPLWSMRIYKDLRRYEMSLSYAKSYINLRERAQGVFYPNDFKNSNNQLENALSNGKKLPDDLEFIQAVETAAILSDKLFVAAKSQNKASKAARYALDLERFTRELMYIDNIRDYFFQIDNASLSTFSLQLHADVYGYSRYLQTLNYKARLYISGAEDAGFALNSFKGSALIINQSDLSGEFVQLSAAQITANDVDAYILYLMQLSAAYDYGFERAGYINNADEVILNGDEFLIFLNFQNGYTKIYNDLKQSYPKFRDYILEYQLNSQDQEQSLKQLYWIKNLQYFAQRFNDASEIIYNNRQNAYNNISVQIENEYLQGTARSFLTDNQGQTDLSRYYYLFYQQYLFDFS